jgi:hypothetical protein
MHQKFTRLRLAFGTSTDLLGVRVLTRLGLGHIAETGRYSACLPVTRLTGSIDVGRDVMSRQVGF